MKDIAHRGEFGLQSRSDRPDLVEGQWYEQPDWRVPNVLDPRHIHPSKRAAIRFCHPKDFDPAKNLPDRLKPNGVSKAGGLSDRLFKVFLNAQTSEFIYEGVTDLNGLAEDFATAVSNGVFKQRGWCGSVRAFLVNDRGEHAAELSAVYDVGRVYSISYRPQTGTEQGPRQISGARGNPLLPPGGR